MTLVPMRGQVNRARHVLKHYFEPKERFFDLTGDLLGWLEGWNTLRAAGALGEAGVDRLRPGEQAQVAVEAGHERYFQIAQAAFTHAVARREVYPTSDVARHAYVGTRGLLVIATPAGEDHLLLTCYRTVPCWSRSPRDVPRSDPRAWEDKARAKAAALAARATAAPVPEGLIERAAVRRGRRPALLLGPPSGLLEKEDLP